MSYSLSQGYIYLDKKVIDSFTHLNSDYHSSWAFPSAATRMAAATGVTTIIDHPMMRNQNHQIDEIESVYRRKKALENTKLNTDIGLIAHLGPSSKKELESLLKNRYILGLTGYLLPPPEPSLPELTPHTLRSAIEIIHSMNTRIALGIYCEYAVGRELAIASPYRTEPLESRLEAGVNLNLKMMKDAFSGEETHSRLKIKSEEFTDNSNNEEYDSLEESPPKSEAKDSQNLSPKKENEIAKPQKSNSICYKLRL